MQPVLSAGEHARTSEVAIALIGKKKHVQRIFLYTSIRVEPHYLEHLWVKRKTV